MSVLSHIDSRQTRPRPDTKIGALYDWFVMHRGEPITIEAINAFGVPKGNWHVMRGKLEGYGLRIERVAHGVYRLPDVSP